MHLSPKEDIELSKDNISKVIASLDSKDFSELNHAVTNILKSIVRELSRLSLATEELEYASLHTRNIFELFLILNHIYSDADALNSWYGQLHKDSEQVRNGFRKLLVKKGLDTTSLDKVKEFEDAALAISPYSSEKNFNVRNLAAALGYEDDYDFVYKLSSKLIHPSSMKVNFHDILIENDKYLSTIILIGMSFGQRSEKLSRKIMAEIA
jgi:hypothetical protein